MPYPPLKPNKVFYVDLYGRNIEVIQNPTGSDIRQMSKEVLREYPNMPPGDIKLRSTQDVDGNKYYWKASESVHAYIEPAISKMVGADLNQNAGREPYFMLVYHALKDGKPVPSNVFDEFAQQYPDVAKQYGEIENYELV
jgi:hypothetical protein